MNLTTFRKIAAVAGAATAPSDIVFDPHAFVHVDDMGDAVIIEATNGAVSVRQRVLAHDDDAGIGDICVDAETIRTVRAAFNKAIDRDRQYFVQLDQYDPTDAEISSHVFRLIETGRLEGDFEVIAYHVPALSPSKFPEIRRPWSAAHVAPAAATPINPRDLACAVGTTSTMRIMIEHLPGKKVKDGDTGADVEHPGPVRLKGRDGMWTAIIRADIEK